jgi:hypothetical protein
MVRGGRRASAEDELRDAGTNGAQVAPSRARHAWRRFLRTWQGYLVLLGVIAALFGGIDNARRIRGLLFHPSPSVAVMSGDINVAVSDFRGSSPSGSSRDAERTATSLAESLEAQLGTTLSASLGEEFDVDLLGPQDVGRLSGDTAAQRGEAAGDRAAELSAHVLVDGDLVQSDNGAELELSLYLSPSLLPNAEELVGPYSLGTVSQVSGDIANQPVLRKDLRDGVVSQVEALVELIAALGYYSQDRFDVARQHLDNIAVQGDQALPDGGVLLHLMQGNIALKSQRLGDAEVEYRYTLQVQPGYGRAYLGLAEVGYLRSVGEGGCSAGLVDVDGVRGAVALYGDAEAATVQSPLGDVAPKVDFGLGRSLWCLSHAGAANDWDAAEAHYQSVVDEFTAGNERIRELAAESYAGLGLLYMTREDDLGSRLDSEYRKALRSYETAIATTHRIARKDVFTRMVGELQSRLGETQQGQDDA